ncbi:MAG TPA: Ig-like domain repeat protein [Jatrophihabitantaceae bacterium]|nr:Ig-like domain repeat protein [Jatrophihabitantaceae bacterium]
MNSVNLSWGPSRDTIGVEGYEVFRSTGGTPRLIGTTDGGITKYAAAHLYASTAYTFAIVALDTQGRTSTPSTATLTTLANANTTAPQPPSDASVSAKPFSDTRIDVVWAGSPSLDVSGYLVLRDGTQVGRLDRPGGLHFSDDNPGPGVHSYTIEAVDSAGNISAPTTAKPPAKASTLAPGTVQIARGPYLSNVTSTSAIVSWWTNIPSQGVVSYGAQSTSEHSATDPAGSVQHHAVPITGLTSGTAYTYTVGDGTVSSAPATLRTAAAPGTPFSFAAIGDFGGASPGESENAHNIAGGGTSFVQTLGDNIYPSAGPPDPDFSTTYSDYDARFFLQNMFGQVVRNQAFFPAIGNQEYYSQGKFLQTFPMPAAPGTTWYSYDWGDAHILVLDTEVTFAPGSPQYEFAQADLAAHQGAAWRIVAAQRPAYSSGSAHSSSVAVQQYLVPLFQQNNVNLVLSGNSHNYERTFPLTDGVPAADGITYVVSGGGGNGHNLFTTNPAPAWSAFRDDSHYEYVKVSVSPSTLKLDAIDAATNSVLDSATLTKPSAPPPPPPPSVTPTPSVVTTTLIPAAAIVRIRYGQRLSVTADLAPAAASGTVQFRLGSGLPVCTATVSKGVATCSMRSWLHHPGSWTVVGLYSGSESYAAASAHFALVVRKATTALTVKMARSVRRGRGLTVLVSGLPRRATGLVTVNRARHRLCAAAVRKGSAHCSFRARMAIGTHTLTVRYHGNRNYLASSRRVRIRITH